jgi:hypothetical protein
MKCEFQNEEQCVFTKKKCKTIKYTLCKYYKRQHPSDKKIFNTRFKKALTEAVKKRDIYNKYLNLINTIQPDYKLSIYRNVKNFIENIETPEVVKKESRPLTKEDLEGNILMNIASNLYRNIPLKILGKCEQNNYLIISEKGTRYLCQIKKPLKEFITKLKRLKKKAEYLKSQTLSRVKI